MRHRLLRATISLATLALLSVCVVNAPPVAEKTPDGLVRVLDAARTGMQPSN